MILMKVFILLFCELLLSIELTSTQFLQTTTTSGSSFPPQCFTYTTIDDGTRHINSNGNNDCDTVFMSGSTWTRFIGESGTQLSTSPTSSNQCGTQVTGWYSGLMPAVSETITDGRVCFSWLDNTCQWSNTIGVTNCGSFYVYQLTMPPVCAARYCTDTVDFPTTTSAVTTLTTAMLSPQCYDYTTIDDPSRGVNESTGSSCDQSLFSSGPTWVRFVGTGGTEIPTSPVGASHCTTHATGWYSGVMPDTFDETRNGTACFEWNSGTCHFSTNMRVTNCGSYYVYQLSPTPGCSMRYCTHTPSNPTTVAVTTTTESTTSAISRQCYDYTTIDDPSRGVNENFGGSCDQNLFSSGPTWVRFVGTGGTEIPTSPVGTSRCTTQATGWYSGVMPDTFDETTNGTACFEWNSGTCHFSSNIHVTNCGSYYVYQLTQTPGCSMRYCTHTPSNLTTVAVTTTTESTTSVMSPQCYDYTTIDDPSRGVNESTGTACDQSLFSSGSTWVRFVGTGGTEIPTSPVGTSRCGTHATGWYSGVMPNTFDETTNGTACFEWDSNTCQFSTNIHVTNCGSYYVYQLSPTTGCYMRYCTIHPSSGSVTSKST